MLIIVSQWNYIGICSIHPYFKVLNFKEIYHLLWFLKLLEKSSKGKNTWKGSNSKQLYWRFTVYSRGRTDRVETFMSLTRSSSNPSRGSRCDRYNVGWDRVAWVAVACRNRCYRQPLRDTSAITQNEIVYLLNGRFAYSLLRFFK